MPLPASGSTSRPVITCAAGTVPERVCDGPSFNDMENSDFGSNKLTDKLAPAPGSTPESSRKKRKDSSKRGTRGPRDGVSMTAEEAGQSTSYDIALDYSGKEKKHSKDKESSSKSRSRRH